MPKSKKNSVIKETEMHEIRPLNEEKENSAANVNSVNKDIKPIAFPIK